MKNQKVIIGISVVALIIAGIALYRTSGFGSSDLAQATPGTSLAIENYVPVVKYNGGIYSELPIMTTSDVTAATVYGATLSAPTGTFNSLTVGTTTGGTAISKFVAPVNCTVIAATTIAASSTKDVDCAVTGSRSGDFAVVQATTSVSTTFLGVSIVAARASTTNDFVTFTLANNTGGTFTWTGTASTSFKAFLVK